VCDAGGGEVDPGSGAFAVGDRVSHDEFGEGTVQQVGDGRVTIVFDRVGYKTLAESVVLERGLLEDA
jgi:ATP-dependent DNA helicase RecQ